MIKLIETTLNLSSDLSTIKLSLITKDLETKSMVSSLKLKLIAIFLIC